MLKVLSVLPVKNQICVAFEGTRSDIEALKTGDKLISGTGTVIDVISIAMTHFRNPEDIGRIISIITEPCSVKTGDEFSYPI
ncbi:MAG: hypothetical protein NC395_11370 [Prevotella sp.]|nr:hypothetical protein [Prevotella sp.]